VVFSVRVLTKVVRSDIDIISTSAIHQGTSYVDFSLKIDPGQASNTK